MFFGFLLPETFLFYFIFTWPMVYLHWQFNNGRCILTELEYYIDNRPYPPPANKDHDYPFMRSVFADFNIKISDEEIHSLILFGLTGTWTIGFLRYLQS
jgi:hypothetical protein